MLSKRAQNRAELRERILHAAERLFADRGFEQATMTDVARAAGVARATVFNHFPSKYSLVEAITEGVFAYYRGILDAALDDESTSTPTLVRALFAHMGQGIEATHGFYSGVFREIMKMQVGLHEGGGAQRVREEALSRLTRLMARGQQRGELRAAGTPEDLARAFDGAANATIVHWLYEDDSVPLRERMERAAEIFLGGVATAAHAEAREPVPELPPLPFNPAAGAFDPDPAA